MVSTMGTRATVDRLKAVDLLQDCTDAQLEEVARLAERVQVGEGEVLAREGRIGREFFLILSGSGGGDPEGPAGQHPRPRRLLRRAGRHEPRTAERHRDRAVRPRRAHHRAP